MALQPTPSRISPAAIDTSSPTVQWAPTQSNPIKWNGGRRGAMTVPSTAAAPTRGKVVSPNAASVPIKTKQPDERMRNKIKDRVRRDPLTNSARTISKHLEMEVCSGRKCDKPQSEWSVFCRAHTCRAILADRERCSNYVPVPSQWNICFAGWHEENDRSSHVHDLLIRRRQWDHHDKSQSAEQQAELTDLFNSLCPDLANTAYPYPSALPSTSTTVAPNTGARNQPSDGASSSSDDSPLLRTPRLGAARQWPAVEIEDAWIETWGMKKPLSVTVTPASVESNGTATTLTEKKTTTWV